MTFPAANTPQAIEQLKTLYQHEVNKQEAERKAIAIYLSDTAVQTLSALHIQFSLLHTAPEAHLRQDVASAVPLLDDLIRTLNSLARQLWPIELDTLNLQDVLQMAVETFTHPGRLNITYEGTPAPELPIEVTIAFYRLAQEVLGKIQADSAATEVHIQLQSDGQSVSLMIHDNGAVAYDQMPGFGLAGLMVRFEQLNGRLTLHAPPNNGTKLTAVWPWPGTSSQNSPGRDPVQDQSG